MNIGDKVIITSDIRKSYYNKVGTIISICKSNGDCSIKMDDKNLNSTYRYCGKTITDSGFWWETERFKMLSINRRIIE